MKYVLFHSALLFVLTFSAFSQEMYKDSAQQMQLSEYGTAKNNIFVEVGASAFVYSVNYERIIGKHLAIRGGLSFLPVQSSEFRYFSILPLSVSYLIGSTHYVELGLGTVFASFNGTQAQWQFIRNNAPNFMAEVGGAPKFFICPAATAIPITRLSLVSVGWRFEYSSNIYATRKL